MLTQMALFYRPNITVYAELEARFTNCSVLWTEYSQGRMVRMGRRQVGRTPGGRCAHNLTGHAQYVLKGLSRILASSILTG